MSCKARRGPWFYDKKGTAWEAVPFAFLPMAVGGLLLLMIDTVKPYELTFDNYPHYLLARVTAQTANDEIIIGYVRDVVEKCRESGNSRVIIQREIAGTLGDADAFLTGSRVVDLGIVQLKIALVNKRSENIEDLRFSVLLLNNRGANIHLFNNIPDAEAWLLTS